MTTVINNLEHDGIELFKANNREIKALVIKQIAILNQFAHSETPPQNLDIPKLDTLRVNFKILNRAVQNFNLSFEIPHTPLKQFSQVKITKREQDIITYYMLNFSDDLITTNDLVNDLGFDRNVAWKYLQKLVEKGLFIQASFGRPSTYKINPKYLFFLTN